MILILLFYTCIKIKLIQIFFDDVMKRQDYDNGLGVVCRRFCICKEFCLIKPDETMIARYLACKGSERVK